MDWIIEDLKEMLDNAPLGLVDTDEINALIGKIESDDTCKSCGSTNNLEYEYSCWNCGEPI